MILITDCAALVTRLRFKPHNLGNRALRQRIEGLGRQPPDGSASQLTLTPAPK